MQAKDPNDPLPYPAIPYGIDDDDTFPRCIECDEVRRNPDGEIDHRVMAGMKCSVCAYN